MSGSAPDEASNEKGSDTEDEERERQAKLAKCVRRRVGSGGGSGGGARPPVLPPAALNSLRVVLPPTPVGHASALSAATSAPRSASVGASGTPVPLETLRAGQPSPSASWEPCPGDLGASLAPLVAPGGTRAMDTSILLPSVATEVGTTEGVMKQLLNQYKHLLDEQARQSDVILSLRTSVNHLARELSDIHSRPHMFIPVASEYNPYIDTRPRPGPKDRTPFRGLDPVEMGWLHRQVTSVSMTSPDRNVGFRRIVDPHGWHETKDIQECMGDLDPRVQWKLWHYAFGDPKTTNLWTVLTDEEVRQSALKKTSDSSAVKRPLMNEQTFRCAQTQLYRSHVAPSRRAAVATPDDVEVSAYTTAAPAAPALQ